MNWTCKRCGRTATAGAMDLLNHTDWLVASPGEGICPRCVREAALADEEILRVSHPMKARQAQIVAQRIASNRAFKKATGR